MHTEEIQIYLLAKTRAVHPEMGKWLEDHGVEDFEWPEVSEAALVTGLAAKRCYRSFQVGLNANVTKIRAEWSAYLDNVLQSGHGSVLEHASYTFAIENVTRVFTGEMNRHRAGAAISEGSMRYIRYENMPFWVPLSIRTTEEEEAFVAGIGGKLPEDKEERQRFNLIVKKKDSREIFWKVFAFVEEHYEHLQNIWRSDLMPESPFTGKKQITSMMRRIIPMGVCTGGIWTLNLRALRHVMTMRCSAAAEEEICLVFSHIAKLMLEAEPELFGDFKQVDGYWVPRYVKV